MKASLPRATSRGAALVLSLLLQACNCSPMLVVPADGGSVGGGAGGSGGGVAGGSGGGTAGGSGGGGSAGGTGGSGGGSASVDGGPACTTAAQCNAAPPSQSLCSFGGTDAGFSCIDQRCVFDCFKGRTCDYDAGPGCLACTSSFSCLQTGCGAMVRQATLEAQTPGCGLTFTSLTLTPTGGCRYTATEGTTAVGTLTQLGAGQYVFTSPTLGTCVGSSTFGQVERAVLSCEKCQFQLAL